MTVQSDGINPLLGSISWTDPITGGYTNGGVANEGTAALVNDLDVRVTKGGTTNYPWKLTSVNTNTNVNGTDNTVDPYERVDVSGASGVYTITVTHKGTLVNSEQRFSIILTGLSSSFTLNTTGPSQIICSSNDALYNFDYQQIGGGTTNFSTTGLPTGANFSTNPTSISANGNFDATIGNLSAVTAGTYDIGITGDNGSETETKNISLRVLHADFTAYPQNLTNPSNGANSTTYFQTLTCKKMLMQKII